MITTKTDRVCARVDLEQLIRYHLLLPDGPQQDLPLVVFLHGAGDREADGNKFEAVARNVANKLDYEKNGFAVLVPQCPVGEIWNPHIVYELIETVLDTNERILNEVYLVGHSMGARGVWDTAFQYPDAFAGLVPVAGVGCYLLAHKIARVPTMIVHGVMDNVVNIDESLRMYGALSVERKKNGQHKNAPLFLVTETFENHNSVLDMVFAEELVGKFIRNIKGVVQEAT